MNNEELTIDGDLEKTLDAAGEKLLSKIAELIFDRETRLLRALADYQADTDIRFNKVESDLSKLGNSIAPRLGNLEERVTNLEARVSKLEDRPLTGMNQASR